MDVESHKWDQELFDRAVREDKPLFLFLFALGQEDTQEIEEKLSQDLATANLIKEKFLLTLVNGQERPDIQDFLLDLEVTEGTEERGGSRHGRWQRA